MVVKMAQTLTAGELLDGHTVLDIKCLDMFYLNAYVPVLQSSGQVVAFMTRHLGKPIPSPALMEQIGTRFRKAVESYADANGIPWVKFGKDDRKIDVMQPHIAAQAAAREVRGGGDRRLPRVPAGLVRLPAQHEGPRPRTITRTRRPTAG